MTEQADASVLTLSTRNRQGFWRRQCTQIATGPQTVFDVVMGVVVPILCFAFDPIVFRGGTFFGGGMLRDYQLLTYSVSLLQFVTLIGWLLYGARIGKWSSVAGGVLLCGAVFSGLMGLAILPYTLLGLVVGIGVLGFIPFLTALVYLRSGVRALCEFTKQPGPPTLIGVMFVGCLLSFGLPSLSTKYVTRLAHDSVDVILTGDAQHAEAAGRSLGRLWLIPAKDLDRLVSAYQTTQDESRKNTIRKSYSLITGESIEDRARIFND